MEEAQDINPGLTSTISVLTGSRLDSVCLCFLISKMEMVMPSILASLAQKK